MVTCATKQRGRFAYYVHHQTGNLGRFGYYVSHALKQRGRFRVQNVAVEGYVAYVGSGALPDFTQAPTAFSATLPMTLSLAAGATYQVVVRQRDSYGLESQNQKPTLITVDGGGANVLPVIPIPLSFKVVLQPGGFMRLLATYPTVDTDSHPATDWYVWIASMLTPPEFQQPVDGSGFFWTSPTGYAAGTYSVRIALHRFEDNTISPIATLTVVVPAVPSQVTPVPSGFSV